MKILKLSFLLVTVIMFLGACSSVKITSDKDSSIDFSQYKTFSYYGWAQESDKILNDLDKRRIESAFGDEFDKRNLQYAESGGDMIVVLFIVTEMKTRTSANTTTTGMGGGYGGYYGHGPGWGWGGGMTQSTTTYNEYDYEVGTLVIDVFDGKEEKLIWEGVATGTVDDNPQSRDENIPKVVAKLMAEFPIAPIGK